MSEAIQKIQYKSEEFEKLIRERFEAIARKIDEMSSMEAAYLKTSESDYVDLSTNMLMTELQMKKSENPFEFYWLGNRGRILINTLKTIMAEIQTKEVTLENIDRFFKKYEESLVKICGIKCNKRKSQNTFYHGSTNNDILSFTPRDEKHGGSKGDREALVYAAYSRDYSLSFIFNKNRLSHITKKGEDGPNAYYKGRTLKDLIEMHDVGGTMYEFSGATAENFGIDKAKDTMEVVSNIEVVPTKKTKVISTLNELAQSATFKVFYDDENGEPKQLNMDDLLKERQKCINELAGNSYGNQMMLQRLREQQTALLKAMECQGQNHNPQHYRQ